MHPSGQIPAYEFAFGDTNPPVHAWAALRIYQYEKKQGKPDRAFLARVFHKLLINFTWWINRKDSDDNHIFSGGFSWFGQHRRVSIARRLLRSVAIWIKPTQPHGWLFYCTTMLSIAMELASEDEAYGDIASKFFEHFVSITDAMNRLGGSGLWNEEDGFLLRPSASRRPVHCDPIAVVGRFCCRWWRRAF